MKKHLSRRLLIFSLIASAALCSHGQKAGANIKEKMSFEEIIELGTKSEPEEQKKLVTVANEPIGKSRSILCL